MEMFENKNTIIFMRNSLENSIHGGMPNTYSISVTNCNFESIVLKIQSIKLLNRSLVIFYFHFCQLIFL